MIANWVKEARKEAGLSGEALGTKLAFELGTARGHTKANISHWETEKHSPSPRSRARAYRRRSSPACRVPPPLHR
jgi:transcriptional regulator with XRE-family HTH domain